MPTFGTGNFGDILFGGTGTSLGCSSFNLFAEVQTTIDELAVTAFWPLNVVSDAINDALLELVPIAFYPQTSTTLTFNTGDTLVAWPNDLIVFPQYLEYAGQTYFPTTKAQLERYDRNWKNASQSQPRFFVLWDEQHLQPWPFPDQTYVFNIWGPSWPTQVSTDTSDVLLPNLLKLAVVYRACARLFRYTRDDLSAQLMKEAEEHEALWRKTWRRFQSDNIKRLRPGTAFTKAQAGVIRIGRRLDGNNLNPYAGP